MKAAHPCPCNGARTQDGKRCLDSLRTAFHLLQMELSGLSLSFHFPDLPQFKRALALVLIHMTQAARSQPVYPIEFQRSWFCQTLACANVP